MSVPSSTKTSRAHRRSENDDGPSRMSRDGIERSPKHAELYEISLAKRSKRGLYSRGISASISLQEPDMPAKSSYGFKTADDSQRPKRQIKDRQTFSMSDFA